MRTLIRMFLLAVLVCAGCAAKEKTVFNTPPGPSAGLVGDAPPMPVAEQTLPDKSVADNSARDKTTPDKSTASSKQPEPKQQPVFTTPPGPSVGLGTNAPPMPLADQLVPKKTVADKTARSKKAPTKKTASSKKRGTIVTPADTLTGKVATYNDVGRFVVLDFPGGRVPVADQRMFVYRGGLKVGEVKINNLQRNHYVVADLTAGEAQSGDEVRDK